jgi:hypothetical protein
VYVFGPESGSRPFLVPHGLTTTWDLHFSPDSKFLATIAGGAGKVWDMQPIRDAIAAEEAKKKPASVSSPKPEEKK